MFKSESKINPKLEQLIQKKPSINLPYKHLESNITSMTIKQKKTFMKVGRLIVKGEKAKERLSSPSNKNLRNIKTLSDKDRLEYKRQGSYERSNIVNIFQEKERRKSVKFSVVSKEGKKLIQNHKLAEARKSVFLLQALEMHKGKVQRGTGSPKSHFLNERLYKQYMQSLYETGDNQMMLAQKNNQKNCFIISYYNVNQLRFDFVTCILVLFDCIMIPIKNSFGLDFLGDRIKKWINNIDIVITSIFALDLFLGFRRAYINERTGDHVTCPRMIAKRYLKFYFWIDLLGLLKLDLFSDITFLRLLQLLKTIRLLRFQKLIHFIGFSTQTRARIRIIQLLIMILICIHWISCLFYVITIQDYNLVADKQISSINRVSDKLAKPEFNFQYWIPQYQLNDGVTDFYEDSSQVQYAKMCYYMILVLTGNDIMPQSIMQVQICTFFLVLGAIVIAIVFGGISAEIQRAKDTEHQHQLVLDFVFFSLMIHDIDISIQVRVLSYLCQIKEQVEMGPLMMELQGAINPGMKFRLYEYIYYDQISTFTIFENTQKVDIMWVAMLMQTRLNINDEEIITQGGEGQLMYMILQGQVTVYLNQSASEFSYGQILSAFRTKKKFLGLIDKSPIVSHNSQVNLKATNSQSIVSDVAEGIKNMVLQFKPLVRKNISNRSNSDRRKSIELQEVVHDESDSSEKLQQISKVIKVSSTKISINKRLKFRMKNQRDKSSANLYLKERILKQTDYQKAQQIEKDISTIQKCNKIPQPLELNHTAHKKNKVYRKPISRLREGQIFGEIGVITNLKRTCTIKTYSSCIFQILSKQDIGVIREKYPQLFSNIYDNMQLYQDEDMFQKLWFIHNVPYLRGLDQRIIKRIVYLTRQQIYEKGDTILMAYNQNKTINIIWQGIVQVRVERFNPETGKLKSLWLANLEKGACFSVFNCFKNTKTIVNFYAASDICVIDTINANELQELGKEIVPLGVRLKNIKVKIQNGLVGDIDMFTFPKRMLLNYIERTTEADMKLHVCSLKESKKTMIKSILNYSWLIKKKLCRFPEVLNLLQLIRNDRYELKVSEQQFERQSWETKQSRLNIRGIYQKCKWEVQKAQIKKLQDEIMQVDSVFDFKSLSTLHSNINSYDSIKCLSFHTNKTLQEYNLDDIKAHPEQTRENCQLEIVPLSEHSNSSSDQPLSSATSFYSSKMSSNSSIDSMIFKKKLKKEIEYDIRQFRQNKIQQKNARILFRQQQQCDYFVTNKFLEQIEQQVFQYHNFKLLNHVIVKLWDKSFMFRNQVKMAKQHLTTIQAIAAAVDFDQMSRFIENEQNQIVKINLTLNDLDPLLAAYTGQNQNEHDQQQQKRQQLLDSNQQQIQCDKQVLEHINTHDECFDKKRTKIEVLNKMMTWNQKFNKKVQMKSLKEKHRLLRFKTLPNADIFKLLEQLIQPKNKKTFQKAMKDQEQFFIKLKEKDLENNVINCNWVYSQAFQDQFSILNETNQRLQKQNQQLQILAEQLNQQQELIEKLNQKLAL